MLQWVLSAVIFSYLSSLQLIFQSIWGLQIKQSTVCFLFTEVRSVL